jgi:glycosyltransferase involved in cell wall biosynthesis
VTDAGGARGSVAFLTTGLGRGGAENQLRQVAERLCARGWRVRVISMLPAPPGGAPAGLPVHSLEMRRGRPSAGAVARLLRLLAGDRPEVLVTFMLHANVLGRLAGRLLGVPVVASIRTSEHSVARAWMERATERLGAVTTTNSALVAQSLARRGVVRAHRLRVVPNGIDCGGGPAGNGAALRAQLGAAPGDFVWMAVGRLEAPKDYPLLLAAMARLRTPARLWIAGDGSLRDVLRERCAALGLGDRVRFLGQRDDVHALLRAADALVLSSAWEGMPNAVMEAMAAGRPVVATRVGGVGELVREDVTGAIVPAGDPAALAHAMERMMSLPAAAREAMGRAGHRVVDEQFGMEAVVDQWESLLLEFRRPRAPFPARRPAA